MSTYAKFPAQVGAGVAPSTFTPVFAGLGTGTYTLNTAAYSVANGVLSLLVKITMTADGSGVAPVTLTIPGGYSYDSSLVTSADIIVGNFGNESVSFASSTTLQFNAINGFVVGTPNTGSDLTNGDVYCIRATFPIH